ncbi:hypothetical protein [Cryptosporangium aurantiacum]|uniref:Uncharacterized protein n=1 Tax=Cryptosporangium aurantiacum TaxID=134849 RepID=A0A1M7RL62_9ACTN|nr:hypothetical protein [Cryptosporangium aurantiacum]SHN47047.1 hypothetical protein SAMN05443668_1203 [Cryptosporangium aurantiacum]
MFIDIYFTDECRVDRDDIEDALAALDGFEVVGAGTGERGSNIDLEVDDSVSGADAVRSVKSVLRQLDVDRGTHLRLTGTTRDDAAKAH